MGHDDDAWKATITVARTSPPPLFPTLTSFIRISSFIQRGLGLHLSEPRENVYDRYLHSHGIKDKTPAPSPSKADTSSNAHLNDNHMYIPKPTSNNKKQDTGQRVKLEDIQWYLHHVSMASPSEKHKGGNDDQPAGRIAITTQVPGSAGTTPSSVALLDPDFRRQAELADVHVKQDDCHFCLPDHDSPKKHHGLAT